MIVFLWRWSHGSRDSSPHSNGGKHNEEQVFFYKALNITCSDNIYTSIVKAKVVLCSPTRSRVMKTLLVQHFNPIDRSLVRNAGYI